MNSTNVPSEKENDEKSNNPAPVCGQTIPTNEGVEIPPHTAKWGISKNELIEFEKSGEVVFSQAGNAELMENGTLKKEDATTIVMVNPKAYKLLLNAKQEREKSKGGKAKTGVTR